MQVYRFSHIIIGMESQLVITYEVIEPVSNKRIVTRNRYEALDYFAEGCIVYEHHDTISKPSMFTQTRNRVTMAWNDNPEFKEMYDGYDDATEE